MGVFRWWGRTCHAAVTTGPWSHPANIGSATLGPKYSSRILRRVATYLIRCTVLCEHVGPSERRHPSHQSEGPNSCATSALQDCRVEMRRRASTVGSPSYACAMSSISELLARSERRRSAIARCSIRSLRRSPWPGQVSDGSSPPPSTRVLRLQSRRRYRGRSTARRSSTGLG